MFKNQLKKILLKFKELFFECLHPLKLSFSLIKDNWVFILILCTFFVSMLLIKSALMYA